MDSLERLIGLFQLLPGIGPRQAQRFVYFLLRQNNGLATKLATELQTIKQKTGECSQCGRFFSISKENSKPITICAWCADHHHDQTTLMVVEKEADLDNIQRSGAYRGQFFVLGFLVPSLRPGQEKTLTPRLTHLAERLKTGSFTEIIIALSASPDGDHTTEYLQDFLRQLSFKSIPKITVLGRGLSTGTELEYSDKETLRQAIRHREGAA